MHPFREAIRAETRRQFFGKVATGIGGLALANLLAEDTFALPQQGDSVGGLPDLPHFAPKAKRVVYLFMNGAPTHTDLFDYKPLQKTMHGQPVPQEFVAGKRFSTMTGNPNGKLMLAPIEPFKQHGQSGAWVSNFLPHIAKAADDICFIKSMHTTQVNHSPAVSFFLSGGEMPGRPTMGAWLSYGLGSDTDSLPSFVAMTSVSKGTTCGHIGVAIRVAGKDSIAHVLAALAPITNRAVAFLRASGRADQETLGVLCFFS